MSSNEITAEGPLSTRKVVVTEESLTQLTNEIASIKGPATASNVVTSIVVIAIGIVGVVQAILLGAWVAALALCPLLLVIGLSPRAARKGHRHHLAVTHPVGGDVTVALGDAFLYAETSQFYCEYALGAASAVVVKPHGVYVGFGSAHIVIPRETLDEADIARLMAGSTSSNAHGDRTTSAGAAR